MRGCLPRWLLLLLIFAIGGGARADHGVLIVRDDTAIAGQVAELLVAELQKGGWSVGEVLMADRTSPPRIDGERPVIALGPRAFAAALKRIGPAPVIGALVSQASLDQIAPSGGRWSAILLDQPAARWANLLHVVFPEHSQVGMLVGPTSQRASAALEKRLLERRISLATEFVTAAEDVVPAIDRLIPRMQLLLAIPDPAAHNRNSVQPLLLTTYRVAIPVVAYSEAYQRAGAVVAMYSTVPQIVAQIVETLNGFRDGKTPAGVQSPRYFTIGVNAAVARSLGLRLPPASELVGRVLSLES